MDDSSNEFRDHIATVNQSGGRVWLYPKEPKGKFYNWRKLLSYFQLIVLFGLPFLKIKGHPAVLINILERKFIFFGMVFWPEDLKVFAVFTITFLVFIIFFTVTFGRIFCGWFCPQTIFLELVFRRIERWIEGNHRKQKKLDASPSSPSKLFKKVIKHGIFFGLSFLIGNTFLSYIIGVEELLKIITAPPAQHLGGLMSMLFFSFLFYGVFSWFREQACIMVCPYGRLQSVLMDRDTITISYDAERGDPRGKGGRNRSSDLGSCVDCRECVAVCPTGIDIRDGLQMECVNCTACIDICNGVMEKTKQPLGLIRYASSNMLQKKQKFSLSTKAISYGILFLALVILDISLFANLSKVHIIFTRIPGSTYQKTANQEYTNVYSLEMLNKTFKEQNYSLRLTPKEGKLSRGEKKIIIAPESIYTQTILVILPKKILKKDNTPIHIEVFQGERLIRTIQTNFLGPERP